MAQLAQRLGLDLADALARDREALADLHPKPAAAPAHSRHAAAATTSPGHSSAASKAKASPSPKPAKPAGFYDDRARAAQAAEDHQKGMWEAGELMAQWETLQAEHDEKSRELAAVMPAARR